MDLPRLLLIADGFSDPLIASKVKAAVTAGVRWVQLRDHDASSDKFDQHATKLVSELVAIDRDVLVTINSRIRIADFHGLHFHTGKHGPSIFESQLVLGSDAPIGISAHNGKDLAEAVRDKAQYVIFSPIFPTSTRPSAKPVGIDVLKKVCFHADPIPIYALGGITPQHVSACLEAGARGVAVHSAILKSPNLVSAIQAFSRALPGL